MLQPEIAQAMAHGDKHPHLVALIVPDEDFARDWAAERTQWGQPIGRHAAIADKIARIAANAFATEAMTMLTTSTR